MAARQDRESSVNDHFGKLFKFSQRYLLVKYLWKESVKVAGSLKFLEIENLKTQFKCGFPLGKLS